MIRCWSTGHKTRSVFDRYHIVSGSDQVEAFRKLAALQQERAPVRRRSATLSKRKPAQNPRSFERRVISRSHIAATNQWKLASPTIVNSNRVIA